MLQILILCYLFNIHILTKLKCALEQYYLKITLPANRSPVVGIPRVSVLRFIAMLITPLTYTVLKEYLKYFFGKRNVLQFQINEVTLIMKLLVIWIIPIAINFLEKLVLLPGATVWSIILTIILVISIFKHKYIFQMNFKNVLKLVLITFIFFIFFKTIILMYIPLVSNPMLNFFDIDDTSDPDDIKLYFTAQKKLLINKLEKIHIKWFTYITIHL